MVDAQQGSDMSEKDFDLRGKEWFTRLEAAHYCGLSPAQFDAEAQKYLTPKRFCGKKLFKKLQIDDVLEQSPTWQLSINEATPGISIGARTVSSGVGHSDRLRGEPLRRSEPRRKQNLPSASSQ